MPTDREKLNADIELLWTQILGAVRDRKIGYIYRLLNRMVMLTRKRDITL